MHKIMVSEVWRIMLGTSFLPAIIFLVLLIFVPESPRWLTLKGDETGALKILEKISSREESIREVEEIKSNLSAESGGFGILFNAVSDFPDHWNITVPRSVASMSSSIMVQRFSNRGIIVSQALGVSHRVGKRCPL